MLMGSITAQATPEFAESESFLFIFLAAIGERQGSSTGVRPGFLGGSSGYLGRGGHSACAHRGDQRGLQSGPSHSGIHQT